MYRGTLRSCSQPDIHTCIKLRRNASVHARIAFFLYERCRRNNTTLDAHIIVEETLLGEGREVSHNRVVEGRRAIYCS